MVSIKYLFPYLAYVMRETFDFLLTIYPISVEGLGLVRMVPRKVEVFFGLWIKMRNFEMTT